MTTSTIKSIVEAAIFAADEPLTVANLLELFPEAERPDKATLVSSLEALQDDYQERGVELVSVASGYRFQARSQYSEWLKRLWQQRTPRYSRALLETLALIAYKQPLTRGEIEQVRGVAVSSHIVKTLIDRNWVKVVGQRDVPGKPALLATTKVFLDYFNLQSLSDLPPLSELANLDELGAKLGISTSMESSDVSSSVEDDAAQSEDKKESDIDASEPTELLLTDDAVDSEAQADSSELTDQEPVIEISDSQHDVALCRESADVIPIHQPLLVSESDDKSQQVNEECVAEEVV